MDIITSRVFINRNATFDEHYFPYTSVTSSTTIKQLPTTTYTEAIPPVHSPSHDAPLSSTAPSTTLCVVCVDSPTHNEVPTPAAQIHGKPQPLPVAQPSPEVQSSPLI